MMESQAGGRGTLPIYEDAGRASREYVAIELKKLCCDPGSVRAGDVLRALGLEYDPLDHRRLRVAGVLALAGILEPSLCVDLGDPHGSEFVCSACGHAAPQGEVGGYCTCCGSEIATPREFAGAGL